MARDVPYGCITVNEVKKSMNKIVENPVIKEFLTYDENKVVFETAMKLPTTENLEALDLKFKEFYRFNRIIRYMSGLIRKYPIDYDKRVKVRNSRYQLVFDKPINNGKEDSNTSLAELISNGKETVLEQLISKEYNEKNLINIKNEDLLQAYKKLNKKQCEILYLYYEKGFNNREIAQLFGQTEANISYWHKKTIRQLREILSERSTRGDNID